MFLIGLKRQVPAPRPSVTLSYCWTHGGDNLLLPLKFPFQTSFLFTVEETKTRLFQYAVILPSQLKGTLANAMLASLADVTLVILLLLFKVVNKLVANTTKYLDSSLEYEKHQGAKDGHIEKNSLHKHIPCLRLDTGTRTAVQLNGRVVLKPNI